MSDTFCPIPWNFQAIQNNGAIRVCCQMNSTPCRGTLKKPDGTPYNAGVDNLDDARNADLIKSVRKKMIDGKWPVECSRCMQEETNGLRSRRIYENESWDFSIDDAKKMTFDDGSITTAENPVVYYDLRFGNVCNLACTMCGPEDSHTWYKDWTKMYGSEWQDTHGKVVLTKNDKGRWVTDAYDWHYSESFWNQIEGKMSHIQKIYFAGGEPMMIERHYEFLQKCIDCGVSNNIVIEYNTNITNLPNKTIEMWKHFKQVRVGASVDGYGDVLEYQRYPAKWKSIEANLQKLDKLPDNVISWIACTVTSVNVFHIPHFMLWKLEQDYKKINIYNNVETILTHHVCHKPWYSSIRVLPQDIKNKIVESYSNSKKEFEKFDVHVQLRANKILDGITKYMLAKDESDKLDNFLEYTTKLDVIRSQNIVNIVPEYKEIIDEYNIRK